MSVQEMLTRSRLFRLLAEDIEQGNISNHELGLAVHELMQDAQQTALGWNSTALAAATADNPPPELLSAALREFADAMEKLAGSV